MDVSLVRAGERLWSELVSGDVMSDTVLLLAAKILHQKGGEKQYHTRVQAISYRQHMNIIGSGKLKGTRK